MFPIHKRFNKLIATFLAVLMLAANPAFIVPVSAATDSATNANTNAMPVITVDKSAAGDASLPQSVFSSDSSRLTNDQKATQFFNQLIPYYLQGGKRQGSEWLKTTDISLSFTESYKPIYSVETIQPLAQATINGQLWFWQGRYAYNSDTNSTANLGIGWRKLSADKTSIVGLNTFYDYAFQNNLSRVGIGAEYFNKLAEYRANFYFPTSGDQETGRVYQDNGVLYSYIRAVQGFDYEVGSKLANAPWLGLYASGFYYDHKYSDDEKGYKVRSTMQLSPRFSLELGYIKSNLTTGDLYGKVLYQLADVFGPSLSGGSPKQDKQSADNSYKILQKVQRNNEIKTETFTRFIAYPGSATITVNDGTSPISGASVSVVVNGTTRTATTDASGQAAFSNLPPGSYTFAAAATGYNPNSLALSVTNATAVGTISLTAQTYTITASAGTGGSISPSGTTTVSYNGSQTYTITPDTGYSIASVSVDGTVLGTTPSTYTFSNVTAAHTISVTFEQQTFNITASAGTNGSISPSGSTTVSYGGSQTYTITPDAGYQITSVTVDGTVLGTTPSTYTFSNVTAAHTISVTFATQTFNITASAGTGGSISPNGTTSVSYNGSQTYTIIPNTGYSIASVTVDGTVLGTMPSTYTFSNVTAAHTISVTFALQTFNITASAGTGGSISPSGTTVVSYNGSQTYTITPNTGYSIAGVTVDGVAQGTISTYTFSNVTTAHTISATFAASTVTVTASSSVAGATITLRASPSGTPTNTLTVTPGSRVYIGAENIFTGVNANVLVNGQFLNSLPDRTGFGGYGYTVTVDTVFTIVPDLD